MVKTQSIDNNGWVPLESAVRHINNNSFLSACLIKVTNPDYLFDFVTDNNISMIMSHRARFGDGYHSTLFERKDNDLIYGIDPDNQDLFPIKKEEFKELWKDNWYLKTDGNAILVSNNNDIFSESTATCGHTFKVINIPEEIAEFAFCSYCSTWKRISKMSPDNEARKHKEPIKYIFDSKFVADTDSSNIFNSFIDRVISKITILRDEARKETGVNLPAIYFKDDTKLAEYEWALLINGYCIEKFTVDLFNDDVERIVIKITESFRRNLPTILKAFR